MTAFTSSGSTAVAFRSDLAGLLSSITTDQTLAIVSRDAECGRESPVRDGREQHERRAGVPELTPQGGSVSGIPVVVTNAAATGVVTLIDASRFAGASDPVTIENFRNASVVMDTVPDSPPVATSNVLSLWQLNMVGILCERWIGIQKLSTSSVAW